MRLCFVNNDSRYTVSDVVRTDKARVVIILEHRTRSVRTPHLRGLLRIYIVIIFTLIAIIRRTRGEPDDE